MFSNANLVEMTAEVLDVNTSNGWHEDDRDLETGCALILSEVMEAFEAYRDHKMEDVTEGSGLDLGMDPATGDLTERMPKPEGVGSEMADVLIRVLDEVHRQGVDPGSLIAGDEKVSVPDFDVPFGAGLFRLSAVVVLWGSEGTAVNAPHVHHFYARALIAALTSFCGHHGINLSAEYERKIAFNRTRGYKHGGKHV